MAGEKSSPIVTAPRRSAAAVTSPVPQHRSSTCEPFATPGGNLKPETIRELHVGKHKIIPAGSQEIGSAAYRSDRVDLISGAHEDMLDEELQRHVILDY